MPAPSIPEGKKRYSITLTIENYEWLYYFITKVSNQHRSHVAITIDEMIRSMKDAIQPILDRYEKPVKSPLLPI